MKLKALIYPLFFGFPRVRILNRSQYRYEEKDRWIPFEGEVCNREAYIIGSSLREWHGDGPVRPVSSEDKREVLNTVTSILNSLGYRVTVDD